MRLPALLSLIAVLALAAPATAQLPVPTGGGGQPGAGTGQPATEPQRQPAEITVGAAGLRDGRSVYVVAVSKVTVSGRGEAGVPGECVTIELFRGRKRVARRHAEVGEGGKFSIVLRVKGTGRHAVRASHAESAAQAAGKSPRTPFQAVRGSARSGSRGVHVRLLQRALARLGYVTSRGGRFDGATGRAVIAFRKVNRMSRTQSANRAVFSMLFAGRGGFKLKYPRAGKHVEADLSRQVLVLARGGRVERIYHTSSGTAATPTVRGSFRFYRKQPGTNAKGMVHSNYFIRGYAIHGYKSVPTHPASHGCLRVPIPNAKSIDNWIRVGDRIFVYG